MSLFCLIPICCGNNKIHISVIHHKKGASFMHLQKLPTHVSLCSRHRVTWIKILGHLEVVYNINPFQNKPWFLCVCSTSLLKLLREKEKSLIMSNFSFSHSVFYPAGELSDIFIKSEIVICKLFQFGRV